MVVYVDLWADLKRDPGLLIADAIGAALSRHLGHVARAAKWSGLENVSIGGWLKIDATKIGKIDGATLNDALKALHEAAKKPVALIIDEAQHALTSSAGEAVMMALKSARDQMNQPGAGNLMPVMSGSDRDKLLRLNFRVRAAGSEVARRAHGVVVAGAAADAAGVKQLRRRPRGSFSWVYFSNFDPGIVRYCR